MPGSARRYAVDFDGSGAIDLSRSVSDAVGSVANYLRRHGWQPGASVSFPARVSGEEYRRFATGNLLPLHPISELARSGVAAESVPASEQEEKAALIELATPGEPSEFRLGLHNFYAITRYNRSAYYASAVADLASMLHEARKAQEPGK